MPRTDPLRNTLDHLALDPAAKDDRRYLVSMLRRLGYTESEIEEALGPEPGRVIEVEYRPGRPNAGHGSFTVVQDEGWQEDWDDGGFSAADDDPAIGHGWISDPALAYGWIAEDEPVIFQERSAAPSDEPTHEWSQHDGTWPAAPDAEAGWSAQDDEPTQAAWPAQEEPAEPAWTDAPDIEEPASSETGPAWAEAAEPAWADEPAQEEAEPTWAEPEAGLTETQSNASEADVPAWAQPTVDEAPAQTEWAEPTEETPWDESSESWETPDSGAWDADDEAAWAEVAPQAPAPSEAWTESPPEYAVKDAPGGSWAPEEPFTYGDYTLHTRLVELGADREQRIYFFAKGQPKSGEPCPLPPGYVVEENDRTGLPFLRRDGGQTTDNCLAITQAGTQCRNTSRETSKYCAVHHGWRGPKAFETT